MSKMPLSYSRLSTYESCPSKFEHLYILKDVLDMDNEHTLYGNRVHEALENYGKAVVSGTAEARDALADGDEYSEVRSFLPLVNMVLKQKGTKYFEHQMAIDGNRVPCDWFSPDVWLRGIADILVINGDRAFIGDWKTGKIKDNPLQLKLFACMVMALFPQVNTVTTAFIWLVHNDVTDDQFTRDKLPELWATLQPRLDAVQESVDLGVFRTRPSPLCNWCPAKGGCPDRRRR